MALPAMKFSRNWVKLKDAEFTTVRWPDSQHQTGWYEIFVRGKSIGTAFCHMIATEKLSNLSDEFTQKDAECDQQKFVHLMSRWYSRKPDWRGNESSVDLLFFRWLK